MKRKTLRSLLLPLDLAKVKLRIWTGQQTFVGKVKFRKKDMEHYPFPPVSGDYLVCLTDENHTYYIDPSHISAINIL